MHQRACASASQDLPDATWLNAGTLTVTPADMLTWVCMRHVLCRDCSKRPAKISNLYSCETLCCTHRTSCSMDDILLLLDHAIALTFLVLPYGNVLP